jgi:hypothetical protein
VWYNGDIEITDGGCYMKKRKGEKIVVVNWEDATSFASWMPRAEAVKEEPLQMVSVGFLLSKKGKNVVISTTLDRRQNNVGDTFVIPKGWVKTIIPIDTIYDDDTREADCNEAVL